MIDLHYCGWHEAAQRRTGRSLMETNQYGTRRDAQCEKDVAMVRVKHQVRISLLHHWPKCPPWPCTDLGVLHDSKLGQHRDCLKVDAESPEDSVEDKMCRVGVHQHAQNGAWHQLQGNQEMGMEHAA